MVKKELISTALKYGLVAGLIMILPFFLLMKMDLKPLINLNTLILEGILTFIFIYFGMREFRDKWNQGILKFWQGMTLGFVEYICIAAIFALFLFMYLYQWVPDYIEIYKLDAVEYLNDSLQKLENEQERNLLLQQIEAMKDTSRMDLLLDAVVKKLVLGLIITPICTVFLRRY